MGKPRTINEYRQVKDTNYRPPISHYGERLKKVKTEVIKDLLSSHTKLFKSYQEEDRREILSLIEEIIVKLDNNE